MGIFFSIVWIEGISKAGAWFFSVDSNFTIACTGFYPLELCGKLEMEVNVLNIALKNFKEMKLNCSNIFICSKDLWRSFKA